MESLGDKMSTKCCKGIWFAGRYHEHRGENLCHRTAWLDLAGGGLCRALVRLRTGGRGGTQQIEAQGDSDMCGVNLGVCSLLMLMKAAE